MWVAEYAAGNAEGHRERTAIPKMMIVIFTVEIKTA